MKVLVDAPVIGPIRRTAGVAGQYQLTADVTYPGEDTRTVGFVGSAYGGPVVMVSDGFQTFVTDPDRFGAFGPDWVRRFFA